MLALPALSVSYGAALAQDKPMATLPSVTISAPRVDVSAPVGATGLDQGQLLRLRPISSDSARLLGDVPGLSLYGSGGVSSLPVIRGLADDRLRIKVDGMDLISACGNHMNPPLSYIDPSNVGNIKVFAGIVPVSVGGDSIGASIHVESLAPQFAAPGQGVIVKGELGLAYRSNGAGKSGHVSASAASESLVVSYNGSTAISDNYKAARSFKADTALTANKNRDGRWLGGDEVGSSSYETRNHALGLALRGDKHLIELKLGLQDIPFQNYPNQRMDMTGNDSTQVNLRYKGELEWGTLEARLYREKTRHWMQFGEDKVYWYHSSGLVPGMPMDTEGKNTGAMVKADIELSARDTLRVGAEFQRYRMSDWWPESTAIVGGVKVGGMQPNTFWNINDGQRDRFDLFAEWEAQWSPQWLSQFGVRNGNVKMDTAAVQGYNASYNAEAAAFNARDRQREDNNLDLTALARYSPDAGKSYEFGYSRKNRSPNLYERYTWSTGGMAMRMINFTGEANGYVGNLDLQPETAHTVSASADWHDPTGKRWGLKVTPYLSYVDNFINARRCATVPSSGTCGTANQTVANSFVYLQFANQDARLYGIDVSGFMPLAKTVGFGDITLNGMLSYVRGKTRGDKLYNMMPLNAKLAVVQKLGGWSGTVEWHLVAAKKNVSAVRNELKTGGYGLVNLRGSYEWKNVRLDIGVDNLLDKFYHHPLGGAYVGQGATMGMAVPWGTPVPGMGRSLYAGVTVKF